MNLLDINEKPVSRPAVYRVGEGQSLPGLDFLNVQTDQKNRILVPIKVS